MASPPLQSLCKYNTRMISVLVSDRLWTLNELMRQMWITQQWRIIYFPIWTTSSSKPIIWIISTKTRMHSSRMRNVDRMLESASRGGGVCFGGVCSGRGCLLRAVSAPGGGVWSWRGLLPGGVCSGGCLLPGSVCSGGVCLGGVCSQVGRVCSWGCLLPGGYIPACTEADPPSVDRQTPVKILPWPNFVAAGKHILVSQQ